MGRIFMCSLLSAALVLFHGGVAMARHASKAKVRGGTPALLSDAGTLSQWEIEELKMALKPPKGEKREPIYPRRKAASAPAESSQKTEGQGEEQGDETQKKAEASKAHNPDSALFNQGLAYVGENQHDSAIGAFTLALASNHRDASSYYNRALLHQRAGKYGAAVEDYTKAARITPNDADLYYNRGLAYQCSGNVQQAIEDYGRAIQLNPSDPWPHWNRGIALSREGRLDLATTDFCSSIDLSSSHGPSRK